MQPRPPLRRQSSDEHAWKRSRSRNDKEIRGPSILRCPPPLVVANVVSSQRACRISGERLPAAPSGLKAPCPSSLDRRSVAVEPYTSR